MDHSGLIFTVFSNRYGSHNVEVGAATVANGFKLLLEKSAPPPTILLIELNSLALDQIGTATRTNQRTRYFLDGTTTVEGDGLVQERSVDALITYGSSERQVLTNILILTSIFLHDLHPG